MKFYAFVRRWLLILIPILVLTVIRRMLLDLPLFGSIDNEQRFLGVLYVQLGIILMTSVYYMIDMYQAAPPGLSSRERWDRTTFTPNDFIKANKKYLVIGCAAGLLLVLADATWFPH